jgi:2,3-bisphosphoglycerate-independent phosphoglycerate mutase
MDGFGLRSETEYNAISAASTPNLDRLFETCPHTRIDGSGLAVGLPDGQMGNSEVGHLNLGAGRVVYQDITRIDKAISEGDFFANDILVEGMKKAAVQDKAVHLFGLVSDGCVHSSMNHLKALIKMARDNSVTNLFLHAFMDGRDTSPKAGAGYMEQVLKWFDQFQLGKVATVGGRYYGMDRDKRWERVEKAYQAIVNGEGKKFDNPVTAIETSYEQDVTDEFIVPVVMNLESEDEGRLSDGDVALFFNFRADRVRQLAYLLAGRQVEGGFSHPDNPKVHLVTMTNYKKELTEARVAFPSVRLADIFGEVISRSGLKQLRMAETEKYAHVTYFFNGGVEEPFENEDRLLINSPKVATYDMQPEMSSVEVTDKVVGQILSQKYDVIILNYANCDMVGHTGIFEAAVKAVEAVDKGIGKVIDAVKSVSGQAIITSDHGNSEQMWDMTTNGPHTAHTTNLVPLIFYDASGRFDNIKLRNGGILTDVAPTMLHYLGIDQPDDMTGKSLFISGEVPVYNN